LSGAVKGIETVRRVFQSRPEFAERLCRTIELHEHVRKHFARGDGERIDALCILVIGGSAQLFDGFVVLAIGEEQPGFGRVRMFFRGNSIAFILLSLLLSMPDLF
jgi:hypothetical protein